MLMEAFKMIFFILSIQDRDCKLFDYYEKKLEFNKNIALDLEQIPKFSRFFFRLSSKVDEIFLCTIKISIFVCTNDLIHRF